MAVRWLVRGLLLFSLSVVDLNDIWSPDVLPNALLAWTIVGEGNLDYDEFTGPGALDREAYFFRACGESTATEPPLATRSIGGPPAPGPNDRVCSIFPPGMALVALPFLAPLAMAGVAPEPGTLIRAGHLVAALVEAGATLLLWAVLRRFVSARWALALILLYALGTSVRTVSSQALWQHAGVHLAVASALWLVMHERVVGLRRELLAGAALGLGAVARQTTAFVALGLAGLRSRVLLTVVAGTALGAVPLLIWNAVAFGNPLEQGYGAKPFDTPPLVGLYGLLLSPSRGFFVYTPYLAFALAAFVLAWRRPGLVALRLRGLSLVWLLMLGLYATYAEWWGGRVFGSRFLDDLAPVLFVALAWGIGQGLLRAKLARAAFWIGATWSLVIFQAAALVYDQVWDTDPINVNFVPARLFDWTDPQWLAVLGSVPAGGPRALVAALLTALVLGLLVRLERPWQSRSDEPPSDDQRTLSSQR